MDTFTLNAMKNIPACLTRLHPVVKVEHRLLASAWFLLMQERHNSTPNPSGLFHYALARIKDGQPILVLKDDLAAAQAKFPNPPTFDTLLTALTK